MARLLYSRYGWYGFLTAVALKARIYRYPKETSSLYIWGLYHYQLYKATVQFKHHLLPAHIYRSISHHPDHHVTRKLTTACQENA